MTLGAFIEYLLDHDCDIARDYDCEVLQIKRRGTAGLGLKITIPYFDRSRRVKAITICRVCKTLEVPIPEDARHAEEVLLFILDFHKNGKKQKPD